jgi:hypothetical protein
MQCNDSTMSIQPIAEAVGRNGWEQSCVVVAGVDRWSIRDRLQLLQIPCECQMGEPLRIWINSPLAALQFWSVMQSYQQPRSVLVDWLTDCWQLKSMSN